MASWQWYRNSQATAYNKEVDWDSDSIHATLHTSSYTPNLDTDKYVSSLTSEVTGTGYTAGGNVLSSCATTYTAANSWGVSRANTTAYVVDTIVRPATGNGFLYRAAVGGTTAGSIPTYPTVVGTTVTDGTVTWECIGSGIVVLSGTIPTWTSSTITARYAVISDRQTGTSATEPLVALFDFGSNQSSSAGTFEVDLPNGLVITIP